MLDLLLLAAVAGFFAACGALLRLAERLMPAPAAPAGAAPVR